MSRRSTNPDGQARVAVVGATTDEGGRLREALAARGIPGSRVDLFGKSHGEVQISEYAGEPRLIQEPDVEEISGYDVIFLCEEGELGARIASAAGPGSLLIDLQNTVPNGAKRIARSDGDGGPRLGEGCYTVPHSLSLLLAELLQPLEQGPGLERVSAVVLRPASDFGKRGVEELQRQTVQLLNFTEPPVETFGRQLAFNLIPQPLVPSGVSDLEQRISRESAELLGWDQSRLTLRLIVAPIFYGHGIQLQFRLRNPLDVNQVGDLLRKSGLGDPCDLDLMATPLDVTGESCKRLSGLEEDGLDGFWLWIVAGETAALGTRQALRLAEELSDL